MPYRTPAEVRAPRARRAGRLATAAFVCVALVVCTPGVWFVLLILGCFDNFDEARQFCATAPEVGTRADVAALKARARSLGIDFGYGSGPRRGEQRVSGHGSAFMNQAACTITIVDGRVESAALRVWD